MADNNFSFTNTPNHASEYDPKDIQDNKVFAILAYIGILVLVPIFGAKNSRFARFHANNGLVLMIIEAITYFVLGILSRIPIVGLIFGVLIWLSSIFFTVIIRIGIINAARGQANELPIIGKIKILK